MSCYFSLYIRMISKRCRRFIHRPAVRALVRSNAPAPSVFIRKRHTYTALVDLKTRVYKGCAVYIKMKVRKKAVEALVRSRKLKENDAKRLEKMIWAHGPAMHQRLVRLLLLNPTFDVARAHQQLTRRKVANIVQKDSNDQYVKEGEVKCRKCGSRRVTKTELQTRSSDEGATTFYRCIKCQSRWKK